MGSSNASRVAKAHESKVQSLNSTPEPAAKKAQKDKNRKTIESASLLKADEQINRFADLKKSHIEFLDGLANTVTAELGTLQILRDATRLANEELEQTHGIIAEANSLSALILAQEEQRQAFERELADARTRWQIEHADRETARKREEESYRYNLQVARRKDDDAWALEKIARNKAMDVELAQREAPLALKEKEVEAALKELVELRDKVATANERAEAEVKKQVAIATNSLKKELEHQAALERLKLENQNTLLIQQLDGKERRITDLENQTKVMTDKYQEAALRVQQIAERAVDATASRPNYFAAAPVSNGAESGKRN